jgi:hypothetical protein
MKVQATLTEVRADGMQKWERADLDKQDHMRYIWLRPNGSLGISPRVVGDTAELEFVKGTGGPIGGHWAGWKVSRYLS